MITIANPIYDAVFKFLMEDQKVAKILLSALLKKEVIELETRRHEYTSMGQSRISLFRIDFSAKVRDANGKEELILIELQKTWLMTETLRFRQYLGTQYLDKENVVKRQERGKEVTYGLPIVSIYILGHKLSTLTEPVVYVRRHYLDYDDRELHGTDPFIESLTHDTIIVQIPYLQGRTRNRLEQILNVFDQDYRLSDNDHFLEVDEDTFSVDAQCLVTRLLKAAAAPAVRREMEIEDEILSEIEDRDTTIMVKNKEIEQKEQVIEQKKQVIEQKEQVIEQKEQVIEQKEQVIEQKEQVIEQKEQVIEQKEQVIEQKEQVIEQKEREIEQNKREIEQNKQVLRSIVTLLCQKGMTPDEIANQLSLPAEEIQALLQNKDSKIKY